MAQQATTPGALPGSNGVLTAPAVRGTTGGNRKKQKRREKAAARQASGTLPPAVSGNGQNQQAQQGQNTQQRANSQQNLSEPDFGYSDGEYGAQEQYEASIEYYSDEEDELLAQRGEALQRSNGMYADHNPLAPSKSRSKKKPRRTQQPLPYGGDPTVILNSAMSQLPLPTPPPPPMSAAALRSVQRSAKQDRIWNTSTQEERERIKEFWLSLSEEERKSLLKIEKEAVLRKMKEQQKHSCSCTVCGRKRTAIEEELEVLYDAYYEELEQYANHQHEDGMPPPSRPGFSHPAARGRVQYPPPLNTGHHHHHHQHQHHHHHHHRTSRVHEIIDDGDQELSEEDDDDEDYSDEDEDEMYSDEEELEDEVPRGIGADFFNFGNSLTVKGGILTVADDLLKNDGKKFIEMMEQLAERRMQREQEAEYAASQPSHSHAPNGVEPPLDDDDEYDDEEEEYDSQEDDDYEEEEDEMGGMTEEQRMEEGRRMFQIFAARMFEQRVLTAYREKVAAERQQKLLEELEDESRLDAQREAKKAKDAEKKKNKKLAQKQAKAEEKAKKEAEKAAEEAAARAVEEKKQEEQRQRKEEQRRKKEAERKAQEEERLRKEADRQKRQQEERERQLDAERKIREQKAQEKRQREDTRKKEQEEKEAREKKTQDQKEKQQAKSQSEKPAKAEEKKAAQPTQPPQIIKRPSQMGAVAVPPGLHPKPSSSNISSPHIPVATPALPKTSAAARPRQASFQDSHGSSPKASSYSTGPSKSTSPSSTDQQPASVAPKAILQNPQKQQQPALHPQPPTSSTPQMPPPPGMQPFVENGGFSGLTMGYPQFQGQHGPPAHAMQQRQSFAPQPPMGSQYRPYPSSGGMLGQAPGMHGPGMPPHGRGFPVEVPPGFPQQHLPPTPIGAPGAGPSFGMPRDPPLTHSRQHSVGDKTNMDLPTPTSSTQPISRPTPIQRPSSVKPQEGTYDRKKAKTGDVDDLNKHLGSSALLDDADAELPSNIDMRRLSNPIGPGRSGPMGFGSAFTTAPGQPRMDSFGNPHSSWSSPSTFGPPGLNTQSWGSALNSSAWSHNNAFGSLGGARPSGPNRPLSIRLAVCQACRQLTQTAGEEYHDAQLLQRQIDANGSLPDNPPSLKEIEDICDTEGDAQNGGGMLYVRHDGGPTGAAFSVRFEPDSGTPNTGRPSVQLGEIGSPIPGNSMPAFSRGFGSIGSLASPGGY